jgi:purine-nucleoside phosphorylase
MTSAKGSDLNRALQLIASGQAVLPRAAVILGSGISIFNSLLDEKSYSFLEIFGLAPGIAGHGGRLRIGWLDKRDPAPILVLEGRYHLYEGHDWSTVTMPIRLVTAWGVPLVLLTNAAGGLNSNFVAGDLMVITAYRDLLNPLFQSEGLLPALKRPPTKVANKITERLLSLEKPIGESGSVRPLAAGTFAGLLGPNYETFAEVEMLRRLGCDAVAMSTIPELETVAATQTEAAAVSVITNVWSKPKSVAGHFEVLESSAKASARLDGLFRRFLAIDR